MFFASLSLAWIAALAIAFICFPRITALVVIAIVYFGITGCAPLSEDELIDREYARVQWVETQLIPAINACQARDGIIVWDGPYTQRVKRILATQNWRALNRTDWHSVRCMERS
jgi:hypothetical protein